MLQEYGKGPEGIQQLKHLASAFNASNRASLGALGLKKEGEGEGEDDDIPELVENFESKLETEATGASSSKEIVDWGGEIKMNADQIVETIRSWSKNTHNKTFRNSQFFSSQFLELEHLRDFATTLNI